MRNILIDRRHVVGIHLDQLERSTAPDTPSIDDAIYASVALRFLMDGNIMGSIAHECGIDLEVESPDFSHVPLSQALLFSAGGYPYGGHQIEPYYSYRYSGPASAHRSQFEANRESSPKQPTMKKLKLSKFLATPCLVFACEVIDRATLVRYVANKCGGAHHHASRAKFDAIDNRLTDLGNSLKLNGSGLSVVFMEVLGTAWLLLQSPGVGALRSVISSLCIQEARGETDLQNNPKV